MRCAHHKKEPVYQQINPNYIQLTHYHCSDCHQDIPNPYFQRQAHYRPSPLPGLILLGLVALIIAVYLLP